MEASGIITLTTDFGHRDPYVGMMKGIILGINPRAVIVDITHEIPPQNILNAAFTLARTVRHFPPGTVHVAVVDPGVGGARKNVAIQCCNAFFVGPDNGIFSLVFDRAEPGEIHEILEPPFILPKISDTFHGRDVYAPCSAQLSSGKSLSDTGPLLDTLTHITLPKIDYDGDSMHGTVVDNDFFGNLITTITDHAFSSFLGKRDYEIYFAGERFDHVMRHYTEVPTQSPLILFGSSGHLEIAVNGGSARDYFLTGTGGEITVRRM